MTVAASAPRASVVMTVYRDLRFLAPAVESVLRQDLEDLELVLVDDGNPDPAPLAALAARDRRIRLLRNPRNLGTAAAANAGVAAARADIIVRLDADDLAEPSRVRRLVGALDGDAALGAVGSAVTLIDTQDRVLGVQAMPESDLEIRWTLLLHNPFYHSAVAFRRRCFEAAGGYRPEELVSQDHYLWFDLLPHCRLRNLPEPLTRYRLNPEGLTARHALGARNRTHAIRERLWADLGLVYDLRDDALALDMTQWLRGQPLPPERRGAAYGRLLALLRAYGAKVRRQRDAAERREIEALAARLIGRMLAEPPDRRAPLLRSAARVSPRATLRALRGGEP